MERAIVIHKHTHENEYKNTTTDISTHCDRVQCLVTPANCMLNGFWRLLQMLLWPIQNWKLLGERHLAANGCNEQKKRFPWWTCTMYIDFACKNSWIWHETIYFGCFELSDFLFAFDSVCLNFRLSHEEISRKLPRYFETSVYPAKQSISLRFFSESLRFF